MIKALEQQYAKEVKKLGIAKLEASVSEYRDAIENEEPTYVQ